MNHNYTEHHLFSYLAALFVILTVPAAPLFAATHLIEFGGTLGFSYSPDDLTVSVGDTIIWQGDFGFHPLSSTSVPQDAPSFSNSSGSTFSYVVTVPGTYDYQCDSHFAQGMVGSFTVIVSSVNEDVSSGVPEVYQLDQNIPNPFNPRTTIRYRISTPSQVELTVYNLVGQKVRTLVSQRQPAGQYQVEWDATDHASGVYYYLLTADEFQDVRKMVLVK